MMPVKVFWIMSFCALVALGFLVLLQSQPALAVLNPQTGSISGICRYYGNLPGPYPMDVCAHIDPGGGPVDDGCVNITFPGGKYTISGLADDNYYVSCAVSLDGSGGQPEDGDPTDFYDLDGDGDHDTVTVSGGNFQNIFIALGEANNQGRLIIYVDKDATGAADGSNWIDAYTQLPPAFGSINPALMGVEIWIADGTYKPTTGSSRTDAFHLRDNVEIYGGFAGTEILREQRKLTKHTTILSGQIGESEDEDNSYHVVEGSGTTNTAILSDVTIMDGYAKILPPLAPTANEDRGGGMLVINGSPIVANVRFVHNFANLYGGGMYVEGSSSSVYIINSLFNNNTAGSMGGGLNIYNGAKAWVINSSFVSNACNPGLPRVAGYNYGEEILKKLISKTPFCPPIPHRIFIAPLSITAVS